MKKPLDLQKKQLRKILKEQRNRLDRESCASSDNAILRISAPGIFIKKHILFSALWVQKMRSIPNRS